jgi:Txe/YoeB family toxin of Txe-Axe toxin-antitoxin module
MQGSIPCPQNICQYTIWLKGGENIDNKLNELLKPVYKCYPFKNMSKFEKFNLHQQEFSHF